MDKYCITRWQTKDLLIERPPILPLNTTTNSQVDGAEMGLDELEIAFEKLSREV